MTETAYLSLLGDRVRAWRSEQGMTRKSLAAASGVSERYLAQLEAGEGNISVLLLRKVARAMGVAVETLVREEAPREKPVALLGLRGAGKSTLGARLAETLGGKGNVVAINGVAGHPANEMRVAGYKEVFGQYPDIKIVNEVNANWDQAQGQQAMQNILATYPDINGVVVQDGMAAGAWKSIMDAGKTSQIAATGEIRKDFIDLWVKDKLNSGATVNPPGVMASALNVAVLMLQGKELKEPATAGQYKNAMYLPIPFIDSKNLADAAKQLDGKPGYYSYTNALSIDDATALFK